MLGRNTHHKERSRGGFTLIETLLVTAILVVLLAVASVAVVQYTHYLQITELDNSAKEIFVAAQNRAVLLKNGGQLESLVIKSDGSNKMENVPSVANDTNATDITAYYISGSEANALGLLPTDAIESTLWDGDFYIVYEPVSGSVVDVFFAKDSSNPLPVNGNFRSFYNTWRDADRETRRKNDPKIGYYGGESAESGTSISLRTPVILIDNSDELTVNVTYWIPYSLNYNKNDIKVDVTLSYPGIGDAISLGTYENEEMAYDLSTMQYSYTRTWTLDSLEEGKQFKDVLKKLVQKKRTYNESAIVYGQDFTINAEVYYDGSSSQQINGASKTATDNSLFADGSDGTTAYICNVRHLQNLSTSFSGVSGKTAAQQKENIRNVEVNEKAYQFQPIENSELTSYIGSFNEEQFVISNLEIDESNLKKGITPSGIGLFGSVEGKENLHNTLQDIMLVNTKVAGIGTSSNPIGVLVGQASYTDIIGCGVYWENEISGETNLRKVLGDSKDGITYQVSSGSDTIAVGGLAGEMQNGTIERSFAATTISAENIGGLVGSGTGLTISKSYSDCYLQGNRVGGLVGSLTGDGTTITASYATGFISEKADGSKAAGFTLGNGAPTVSQSYSTLIFTGIDDAYPLCENIGSYTNTYYLTSTAFSAQKYMEDCARDYVVLTNSDNWAEMFEEGTFTEKDATETNPYNLQTTLSLTAYEYPGLKDIPHYGDWGAQFRNGSLVYFEQYKKDSDSEEMTCVFNGANLDLLVDDYVVEDGYAVAFRSDSTQLNGLNKDSGVTLTVNDSGKEKTITYHTNDVYTVTHTDETTNQEETYILLPLPDEIVNTSEVEKDFYRKISFSIGEESNSITGDFYYNPHFANAIVAYSEDMKLSTLASNLTAIIRTPRHLYQLSEHAEYYANTYEYTFKQEMNLDYATYDPQNRYQLWETSSKIAKQREIGTQDAAFNGTYLGEGHTIENVTFTKGLSDETKSGNNYYGLFGNNTGTIQDVAYLFTSGTAGSITSQSKKQGTVYAGGLVGVNSGIVTNCAVANMEMNFYGFNSSTIYVGGLVGWNRGMIRNSSAALDGIALECTLSDGYAGGFVGLNDGTILQSYAVGYISATLSRDGTCYGSGFVGKNSQGIIQQCYAATGIEVGGGAVSFGFSSSTNSKNRSANSSCYYLNNGNFEFNGNTFTSQYNASEDATPVTYEEITKNPAIANSLGMTLNAYCYDADKQEVSKTEKYNFPAIVQNNSNTTLHYGNQPTMMNLGEVGVYYWEKEVKGNQSSYQFSAIRVNEETGKVSTIDTLCTAHDDGGVITEYGYGYFYIDTMGEPSLSTSDSEIITSLKNTSAEDAFRKLMPGYRFVAYTTINASGTIGLYPSGTNANCTWTLTAGGGGESSRTYSFTISPLFANALSYQSSNVEGIDSSKAPTGTPGSSSLNYGIRSIEQLQFINWDGKNQKLGTIATSTDAKYNYNYLTYYKNNKLVNADFYWKQSHDISGEDFDAENGDEIKFKKFTPIAPISIAGESSESSIDRAYTWFGSTYDGDDYVIEEVSIQTTDTTKINATGLFSITIDATLKNIIMNSPSGEATITTTVSRNSWYAIGGLVGLAAQTNNSSKQITNCSVSNYKILDQKQTGTAFGAGCVGGLVGVCNMTLKNCTADTTITLNFTHDDRDRNIRIGGIAGSLQGSIEGCYAGGKIEIGSDAKGSKSRMHIGGIVGGYFMKTVTIDGTNSTIESGANTQTEIKNCYSYVELPQKRSNRPSDKDDSLFVIGGRGEIAYSGSYVCKYTNCYYLETSLINNKNKNNEVVNVSDYGKIGVNSCTYAELADQSDSGVMAKLNKGIADGEKKFGFVTTKTDDGISIDGKYSFGSETSLLGLNYPFPTILTQSNGKYNVHYGNWPVQGIQRVSGNRPIDLDLFTDYSSSKGSATVTEQLKLSSLVSSSGTLKAAVADDTIASVSVDSNTKVLSITGLKSGNTTITVSYVDGSGNKLCSDLEIDLYVTAELQIVSGATPQLFTNETALIPLYIRDKNGNALDSSLLSQITFTQCGPVIADSNTYFSQISGSGNQYIDNSNDIFSLKMNTKKATGTTSVTMQYTFTYNQIQYTATNPITIEVVAAPTVEAATQIMELKNNSTMTQVFNNDAITVLLNGERLTDVTITKAEVYVGDIIYPELRDGTLSFTATWSSDANDGEGTNILLTLQVKTSDGVVHNQTLNLVVQVFKTTAADFEKDHPADDATDDPSDEQELTP